MMFKEIHKSLPSISWTQYYRQYHLLNYVREIFIIRIWFIDLLFEEFNKINHNVR